MSKSLQAIRGMNDILPEQTPVWRYFEGTVSRLLDNYGYKQIRMPIVEFTELFKRSIGEVTDIVEKEMYTFEDRNGDSLTLRPEGTAACVRAVLEHGITGGGQVQKLWYIGPSSVTSVHRKAVIASSTRSVWRCSTSTVRTSTPN